MGIETTEHGVTEEHRPPHEGEFVEVTEGEHKGRYGAWHATTADGKWATIMTRDNNSENIQAEVGNLKPSRAGHR